MNLLNNSLYNEDEHIKIIDVFCKDIMTNENNIYETIFEFSNDFIKLRKLIHKCNSDFYVMYEILLPIEKYTGIRDYNFDL